MTEASYRYLIAASMLVSSLTTCCNTESKVNGPTSPCLQSTSSGQIETEHINTQLPQTVKPDPPELFKLSHEACGQLSGLVSGKQYASQVPML